MTDWKYNHVTLSRLRMHYVRDGNGPTLVLLHGWPEFWYTWRKNIPALAESFDLVVPDLRGFGDSDKPANVPDVSDYANHLIELLDALDITSRGFRRARRRRFPNAGPRTAIPRPGRQTVLL